MPLTKARVLNSPKIVIGSLLPYAYNFILDLFKTGLSLSFDHNVTDGVCRECIPGSQFIGYTAYSTDKRLKDILQKLDEMKTNWKGMKF